MVDWKSPEVLAMCASEFAMLTISVTTGFMWYLWKSRHEVEVGLLTRRLRPRYAHIPYLLGRYAFLGSSIMFVITTNYRGSTPLNCQPFLVIMPALGNLSMVASSVNMLFRPLAMSNFNPYLVFPITLITLGHIALALEVPLVGIQAVWDPALRACTEDPNLSLGATSEFVFYTYTVIWDLSILLLTCAELYRQRSVWDAPIGVVLRRQGFIYMSVTCITNITSLLLAWMNLNLVMDIMFSVPGGAINVILSSQLFTSLYYGDTEGSLAEPTDLEPKPVVSSDTIITELRDLTMLSTVPGLGFEQNTIRNSSEIVEERIDGIHTSHPPQQS